VTSASAADAFPIGANLVAKPRSYRGCWYPNLHPALHSRSQLFPGSTATIACGHVGPVPVMEPSPFESGRMRLHAALELETKSGVLECLKRPPNSICAAVTSGRFEDIKRPPAAGVNESTSCPNSTGSSSAEAVALHITCTTRQAPHLDQRCYWRRTLLIHSGDQASLPGPRPAKPRSSAGLTRVRDTVDSRSHPRAN